LAVVVVAGVTLSLGTSAFERIRSVALDEVLPRRAAIDELGADRMLGAPIGNNAATTLRIPHCMA
jgi:hypothetical protein